MIIYLEKWQTLTMAEPELRCAGKHRGTWHVQQPGLKSTGAAGMKEWGEKNSPNDIISCCSVLVRLTSLSSTGFSNCLTQKEHTFCILGDFMWHLGLRGISSQLFPSTDGTRWVCRSILLFSWRRICWLEQSACVLSMSSVASDSRMAIWHKRKKQLNYIIQEK